MHETCFCGWTGDVVDREPIYMSDGEWALACPACGHIDGLDWLPEAVREWTLVEARHRYEGREAAGHGGADRIVAPTHRERLGAALAPLEWP